MEITHCDYQFQVCFLTHLSLMPLPTARSLQAHYLHFSPGHREQLLTCSCLCVASEPLCSGSWGRVCWPRESHRIKHITRQCPHSPPPVSWELRRQLSRLNERSLIPQGRDSPKEWQPRGHSTSCIASNQSKPTWLSPPQLQWLLRGHFRSLLFCDSWNYGQFCSKDLFIVQIDALICFNGFASKAFDTFSLQ